MMSNCNFIRGLLAHLCGNPSQVKWIEQWLAYPLQHENVKMSTAIVSSGEQGCGKSLFFGNVMCGIYGSKRSVVATHHYLNSPFTDWSLDKNFVVVDEVLRKKQVHERANIKDLLTSNSILINQKGKPERIVDNRMNFVFLSDSNSPLPTDGEDRRFIRIAAGEKMPVEFYTAVARQIRSGGVEAFYEYLMGIDLSTFDEGRPFVRGALVQEQK